MSSQIKFTLKMKSTDAEIKSRPMNEYESKCKEIGCYEVIPDDVPVKLYADIEFKMTDSCSGFDKNNNDDIEDFNQIEKNFVVLSKSFISEQIQNVFNIEPLFAVTEASSISYLNEGSESWIISFHIIVTNIAMLKSQQKHFWNDMNKRLKTTTNEDYQFWNMCYIKPELFPSFDFFDESVYSIGRKMRSPYCSKEGQNRPMNILEGSFNDTIISLIDGCEVIETRVITETETVVVNNQPFENFNDDNYIFICEAIKRGLLKSKADKRLDWLKMGYAINGMFGENGEDLFIEFSKISPRFLDKCRFGEWSICDIRRQYKEFINTSKIPVTMGTIKRWVRDESPEINNQIISHLKFLEKEKIRNELIASLPIQEVYIEPVYEGLQIFINPIISSANEKEDGTIKGCGDYDIAVAVAKCFGKNFKCVSVKDNTWYEFTDYSWRITECGTSLRNIISNDFRFVMNERAEIIKKQLEGLDKDTSRYKKITGALSRVVDICNRLSRTCDKKNIMTELRDILYDADFEKGFNTAKNVLPIKGGLLYDMITRTSRFRTIDDKFDYECPVSFIPEINNDIDEYYNQLFCGDLETKQQFLNAVKSTFSGTILRYFFICSGDGCNGKSLTFKLLSHIFGKGMDIISDKVAILSKSQSNLNTEMEKLDKIRLGYISELPDNAKLNEKIIKSISGGDPINLRTLNTKDKTIYPTSTLWGLFNSLPQFKTEKSMLDRIVNFPFNANFPINKKFEEEILTKLDAVFSYIILKGIITDTIVPSPAMLEKKQEYIDDQANPLIDYIDANIERGITPTNKRDTWCIKRDDFQQSYYSWCSLHHKRDYEISAKSAFTKAMSKMGISNKESNHVLWFENIQYRRYDTKVSNTEVSEIEVFIEEI